MPKRILDIIIAALLLLLSTPLLLFAAIGIRLTSPGPIFYHAERMGRFERPFVMLKFRTMHMRADSGSQITGPNDVRIFGFGALLRTTKIDELPQFWNVLTGQMSIVGPRPESVAIVRDHYTDWMKETLRVRPGVTSPGSIFGYTHGDRLLDDADPEGSYLTRLLAPKLAIERAYLDHANVWHDIGVMLRTGLTITQIALGRTISTLPPEAKAATRWHNFLAIGKVQS